MSKMAIPTMDVVRFKEDDIIVASNPIDGLELRYFGDGIVGNATADGQDLSSFLRLLVTTMHGHTNIYFTADGVNKVHVDDVLDYEEEGVLKDGIYTESEDGSDIIWTWRTGLRKQ